MIQPLDLEDLPVPFEAISCWSTEVFQRAVDAERFKEVYAVPECDGRFAVLDTKSGLVGVVEPQAWQVLVRPFISGRELLMRRREELAARF